MSMRFTEHDRLNMEARYGRAYFLTLDGQAIVPATHVEPIEGGDLANVTIHPTPVGMIVNWSIVSQHTGKTLLRGEDRSLRSPRQAIRGALRSIRGYGIGMLRVRPGQALASVSGR